MPTLPTIITQNSALDELVVLTPNHRTANFIQQLYINHQISNKCTTWPQLRVYPLNTWLKILWQQRLATSDDQTLLTTFNELQIWQTLASKNYAPILCESYQLLRQWQIEPSVLVGNLEQIFFSECIEKFSEICQKDKLLSLSDLPAKLTNLTTNNKVRASKQLLLINLSEITPDIKELLNSLEKHNTTLEHWDTQTEISSNIKRVTCPDPNTEYATALTWAQKIHSTNPQASIGIVVPNLTGMRNTLLEVMQNNLTYKQEVINISLGQSLNDYPVIAAALNLLHVLISPTISQKQIQRLLQSPYLHGFAEEKFARSFLATHSFEALPPTFSLPTFVTFAQSLDNDFFRSNGYCPLLLGNIDQAVTLLKHGITTQKITAADFINLINQLLEIFSWPNQHYSLIKRWLRLEQEFLELDILPLRHSPTELIELIEAKCQATIFQPDQQQQTKAKINILGLLEASGLNFDYLWISGLNNDTLPTPARPNPLLPIAIQKKLQLPHFSNSKELEFAEKLLARFYRSAKNIIISHATNSTSNSKTFTPSTLITAIPKIDIGQLELNSNSVTTTIAANRKVEKIIDTQAPKVTSNEKIWGGSEILELFAACPFRAFATCRLKISQPPQNSIGLNAKERGILIHAAMATLWQQIKTQHNLSTYNQQKLNTLISYALTKAVDSIDQKRALILQNLLQLEAIRNQQLIKNWLEQELLRTPFTVIATEKSYTLKLDTLTIKMQIDRIDQLEDKSIVVIDYKSGKNVNNANAWQDERLDDTQIPLYALTYIEQNPNAQISALAYAQINGKNITFSGISTEKEILPQVKSIQQNKFALGMELKDCNDLINHLKNSLEKLATQFIAGEAAVDPKYGKQSCRYCHLEKLCRRQ